MSAVAMTLASNLLQIDRGVPFDSVAFKGLLIAKQDTRSLTLTAVDLNKVILICPRQSWVADGDKSRRSVTSNKLRLDARVLQTVLENRSLIPEDWKTKGYIHFDGTLLHHPGDRQLYVMYLFWFASKWHWGYHPVGQGSGSNYSACLDE